MSTMNETFFASPERTAPEILNQQIESVSHNVVMDTLMEAMGGILVILNQDRQVINVNHAFLDYLGISNVEKVLGLRLGESLHCIHAHEKPHGCGTTPHCPTCGAAIAMMLSLNENKPGEEICALSSEHEGVKKDMCLLIRTHPISFENQKWVLVFAQDITQQQFWINLERVFFHDVNNILTSLCGNIELLHLRYPDDEEIGFAHTAAQRLSSEIALQRSLSHQKNATYMVRKAHTSTKVLMEELQALVNHHMSAKNKQLIFSCPEEDCTLFTDPLLVSRILGNMVINALEATASGGTVKVTTQIEPTAIAWSVWNDSYIPSKIQKRIFQRHFSTKSDLGRGLGTYSMKLFGEEFLQGTLQFTSHKTEGTTFTFCLPTE